MKWKKPETAPKNGNVILADMGLPYAVAACWNGCSENWTIASQQVEPVDGVWNDTYFESDWMEHREMRGWMELPQPIGRRKRSNI